MDKNKLQEISFQIISFSGDALSTYFEALDKAKQGLFDAAAAMVKEGDQKMYQAHHMQTEMIQAEAKGEDMEFSIIAVHAQDHLMNAMLTKKLIIEMIELYKR